MTAHTNNDPDLAILIKAKEVAESRVEKDPSTANLTALEKARNMIASYESGRDQEENVYSTRISAVRALQRQGYKIGKSKFYKDCATGICKMEPDGSITEKALENYTRHPKAGLKRLDRIDEDKISKEKTETEIEKLKTQVRLLQHDLAVKEGRYISRDDFEMELASRWVILKLGVEYMIETKASEWVYLVSGQYDSTGVRSLKETIRKAFDERFDQFSRLTDFKVEFIEKIEEETQNG